MECSNCLEEKPLTDFLFRKPTQYQEKICKVCRTSKLRKRSATPEHRALRRAWARNNPEKVAESNRVYKLTHKEQVAESNRQYRSKKSKG